jgi:hypothetical protein
MSFNILFVFVFFFFFFFFFLYILVLYCLCIILCIISPFVLSLSYFCTSLRPMPPGGNTTAVNKYHNITTIRESSNWDYCSDTLKLHSVVTQIGALAKGG